MLLETGEGNVAIRAEDDLMSLAFDAEGQKTTFCLKLYFC